MQQGKEAEESREPLTRRHKPNHGPGEVWWQCEQDTPSPNKCRLKESQTALQHQIQHMAGHNYYTRGSTVVPYACLSRNVNNYIFLLPPLLFFPASSPRCTGQLKTCIQQLTTIEAWICTYPYATSWQMFRNQNRGERKAGFWNSPGSVQGTVRLLPVPKRFYVVQVKLKQGFSVWRCNRKFR